MACVPVTVKLPIDVYQTLDAYCRTNGVSRSSVIRLLVVGWMTNRRPSDERKSTVRRL